MAELTQRWQTAGIRPLGDVLKQPSGSSSRCVGVANLPVVRNRIQAPFPGLETFEMLVIRLVFLPTCRPAKWQANRPLPMC